ncbi:MAG TPA: DoxX family protein [Candidatus Acidoferrum sp.]|nr:DoxX family protein [Candidatus Acidoferrum sp.]
MKFLGTFQPLGLLILRAAVGLIFLVHGYPKLTRSAAALEGMFVQHGLPAQLVYVAGVLETFGGLLLMAGLFARPASLLLAVEMGVAIVKVHGSHGIMALHEYEFPLALGAACLALATAGAGVLSLDHLLFGESGAGRARPARPVKK